MRIFLAMLILGWHSETVAPIAGYPTIWHFWMVEYSLVPMFFALSGFLITGSGMRLSLANFLINRGLRIVPALALEIVFSAIIIGPLFTNLPLRAYFTNSMFFSYFLNILGYIHFSLPGVFSNHALTFVNLSLWTIPYELICYVLISILIVTKWLRSPRVVAVAAFGMILAAAIVRSVPGFESTFDGQGQTEFDKIVRFFLSGAHATLLPSFLLGVLAYQLRHHLPYDRRLFVLGVAIVFGVGYFGSIDLQANGSLRLLMLPTLAYLTVYIGVSEIPRLPLYSKGDYSYGIYLYHMPFQQIIVGVMPGLNYLSLFVISVPVVTLVAMFSWHVVEKPILRLRKSFSFVARQNSAKEAATMRSPLIQGLGKVGDRSPLAPKID